MTETVGWKILKRKADGYTGFYGDVTYSVDHPAAICATGDQEWYRHVGKE
jgi:hypothetical protein